MIKSMQLNPRLVAMLGTDRATFALTIGLGFIGGISAVIFAWLMSNTINAIFLIGKGFGDVTYLLGGMFVAAGVRAVAHWGSDVAASRLALNMKKKLRSRLLEHLIALGPEYGRGERGEQDVRTGELTNSLTEGVEALDAYFSQYLPQIALSAIIPLGILIFVFPLDPLSGLVLSLTAPLIPVFMLLIGSTAEAVNKRQWLSLSRMSAYLLDVLQGLSTLKIMGRSKAQVENIKLVSERLRGSTMEVLRVTFLSALTLELVTTISTAVVAVQVGLRLLYGYLGFEEAFFILLLAPEFYLPLRRLGTRFHAGLSGATAAGRIFDILDVRGENKPASQDHQVTNPGGSIPATRYQNTGLVGDIQFKDVCVRYRDGRTALEDVSFEIKAGSKTALVGMSGAGKSTIAGILLRFIKHQTGDIWIFESEASENGNMSRGTNSDQVNYFSLDQIPAEAWRENIAWVSQESYLFNESVEANIRLGNPRAAQEDVEQASKLANAHDFILTLPEGYRTVIGERGERLSAGQAQRIALARAFLKDAPILILDEPSAHLDAQSESLLMKSTERLMEGRTTLVIAHRLNTIYQSDQIILLSAGKIEAIGTHQELVDRSETYRQFVATFREADGEGDQLHQSLRLPGIATDFVPDLSLSQWEDAISTDKIKPLANFKRLIGFLSPFKWRIVLSVVLGWATIISGIGLMATSAFIIAKAGMHPPIAELQVAIVGVRTFGISRGLFRYLDRLTTHDVTLRVLSNLRIWLYQAIEPLVPARLGSYRSGDLLKRMTGDIASLEYLFVRGVAPPIVAVFVTVSSMILLAYFDVRLALAFLMFILAGGIGLPAIIKQLGKQTGKDTIRWQGTMSAAIVDGLQGLRELLSFRAAGRYQARLDEIQDGLYAAQAKQGELSATQSATLGLLEQLAALVVLSLAIGLVAEGQIESLYLGLITLIVLTSFEALQPLPLAAQVLSSNLEVAERLFSIADTPPAVKEPVSPRLIPERWSLEVEELSFSYANETGKADCLALENISFMLPDGMHMAIVGPSGAGKSTLVRLLTRSWEYSAGSMRLNGYELNQYSGNDLRMKMAVVSQNPYLFTATILDNLRIVKPQSSMEEIIRSAKVAHIHDFIQTLPKKYNTWVGEQGLRLSAGERQRIAVARALLKDAELLVLDEATANLDVITEQMILTDIFDLMKGHSLLMITHRLVGMEMMDEVLVLEEGRLVERGKHATLLAEGGLYCRMWEAQQRISTDCQVITGE